MVMSRDSAVIAAWERWKFCTLEPKGAIFRSLWRRTSLLSRPDLTTGPARQRPICYSTECIVRCHERLSEQLSNPVRRSTEDSPL